MADTPINIPLGGSSTISSSGNYGITFAGAGTLNVTGAGTVANLDSIAGVGLLETFNVENGATAVVGGVGGLSALSAFNISGGSTLEFSSAVNANILSSITFNGPGALKLDPGLNLSLLNTPIGGFSSGDSIDFNGVANGFSYSGNTLTLTENGTVVKTLSITPPAGQTLTTASFQIQSDGAGGTIVGFVCFLRGTHMATPSGERLVEDLAVGDLVNVLSGEPAPIKWIGKRKFKKAGLLNPTEAMPIRVRKDALAPNVPHADLFVSPAHCLFLEGALIPAQFLVNGCTIVQDFEYSEFEYFHIELEEHAVLLAENAPAESYLDTGNRAFFANTGVVELFPDSAPKEWEDACAPFVTEGPLLATAKQKLLLRAEELGFKTVSDPALHLRVDGHDLAPVAIEGGVHTFALPRSFSDIRITSRSSVAAEVGAAETDDRRRLGVAINRIVLSNSVCRWEIPMDHPKLTQGLHDCERQGGKLWRWSNGEAHLPVSLMQPDRQPTVVEIHLQGTLPGYRLDDTTSSDAAQTVRRVVAA